jgi:hypothetical protein
VADDPHSTMHFDQAGDVSSRDVAGRDVHRVGFTGSEVQTLLAQQTAFQDRILSLFSELITQVNRDVYERHKRQAETDKRQERLGLRLARIEFWLLALNLLWIIGAVFLIWLLVDRYVAEAAARLAAGAAAALMLWRALH